MPSSAAKGNSYPKTKTVWGRVAEYLLWIYVWFYMARGLNYSQPNIYQRTGMKPAEVDKDKLREFAYRYADSLNLLSEGQRVKSEEQESEEWKRRVSDAILNVYEKMGQREGINAPFNPHPHVKTMVFTPFSSMAGVTGSMAPFFCEFTLNGDIRPHDYPAIYAHEYAHFLGIANEGEANFYSYIVCTSSTNQAVRFSGYYHIFFHVLHNVFDILGEKEGEKFLNHIRPEIIRLAKDDRHYWLSKRSKVLDAAQDFVFDLYLKGNNVSEGRKKLFGCCRPDIGMGRSQHCPLSQCCRYSFFVLLSHFFSILHIATSWHSSCPGFATILLTLLRKALHHLSLYLIDALYLVLSKELRVFLVILLTDVENLLAHLETLLYLLLGLRLRASPVAAGTRSKSPYLFLALGVSVNKLTFVFSSRAGRRQCAVPVFPPTAREKCAAS